MNQISDKEKKQVLLEKAKKIKLLIFDIDGVLTDGSLFFDNQGQEYKAFNSKDGHGIRLLLDNGINVAIITGRKSELVMHRANNLKIPKEYIYQGYRDKVPAFYELLEKTKLEKENIAFIGDDVIDLPIMSQVGLSIATADAHWFVQQNSDLICQLNGGRGAGREACEFILEAHGLLDDILQSYIRR